MFSRFRNSVVVLLFGVMPLAAQNIPVSLEYTRLYDYLDELATDGVIRSLTEAVRPFTRVQVAQMLVEAEAADSLMNKRQKDDLAFYLNEFSLERDTMRNGFVQYTDHQTFNLSLADPQFSYMTRNKMFKMQIKPILGAEVIGSQKGAIIKRWYGAELQMDIAHHVSIWGSLRDVSWNGNWFLRDKYFPTDAAKRQGAWLHYGALGQHYPALSPIRGAQYKEADYGADFSDSKGGINLYTWWGSIGLSRENVRWGDAYHASNILSGRNPAVPQLTLQLTPVWWFQFDYFHAWLVSNVLNSEDYYIEQKSVDISQGSFYYAKKDRPRSKYMAANMFTFKPCKWVHFSFGNSIVYAENNPQAAYFIPFAFYKSLDHLLTKGVNSENQNSQAFATLTVRPVDHLKLYGSFYLDEFKFSRLTKSDSERNPVSYLVGFDWMGWPIKGLGLKGEFMRSYIACYTHSIEALEFTSNSYNMGHYMGDNAQSIFVELSYRPYKGMWVALSYTGDTKYNQYYYVRSIIGTTIAQKPFNKPIYKNDQVDVKFTYEVHPNMYLVAGVSYNNSRAFDNKGDQETAYVDAKTAEQMGSADYYLNKFAPAFYQGKNISANIGFSFGF